jgi:hypothetical protein
VTIWVTTPQAQAAKIAEVKLIRWATLANGTNEAK